MEIRYLRAFLAICAELHFGRAAARLHCAQPTLSEHLRRLESSVGARLIERGPRGVALTEAGRAFEPAARRGLAEIDAAVAATREVGAGLAGTVRIGFNHPAGRRVLPTALRRLRRDHPRLRPVLTELRSGPQLAAVSDGRLDIGFVFGVPGPPWAHRRVLRTRLVAVVAPDHPLAEQPSVAFADLAAHPCVLFDRALSPASYDAVVESARTAGVTLQVVDEVDDSTATGVVVAGGGVVGFASAIRARDSAGLRPVELVGPVPELDVCAVWPREGATAAAARLLDTLTASGHPPPPAPDAVLPGGRVDRES